MQNLLPYFIQQQYQQHNFVGRFSVCSMFVDISGFTQTTEALIRSGQAEGVEVLSEILRFYFTPTVQSVYAHGGFIIGFAGDAFTAVFPIRRPRPPVARQLLAAASEIQRFDGNRGSSRPRTNANCGAGATGGRNLQRRVGGGGEDDIGGSGGVGITCMMIASQRLVYTCQNSS